MVGKDETRGKKSVHWLLTKKGSTRLKEEESAYGPYKPERDTTFRVVIYDIPETLKSERNTVRGMLKQLGFTFLQGSVWVGKKKIPERFILELEEMDILQFFHIFEVEKEGSIIHPDLEEGVAKKR